MKKLLTVPVLGTMLVLLSLCSIFIGVKSISIMDIWALNESQLNIILSSRLPRTISIIISGATLSICGLIMQQLTRNKFVSPTTAGTMDWAKLGVVVTLLFFRQSPLLIQLLVSSGFAIVGSLVFIRLLKIIPFKDEIFIPLTGLMLGQVISAITVFIGNEFQILQSVNSWLQGNFAIVTSHRYELLYLAVPCIFLTYLYAHQFTIVGMGESFARNLGISYDKIINLGLIIVSVMTALVIIVVGTLPFLGLIVPNIISSVKGDHLSGTLTLTSLVGAVLVMICDIAGRLIIFPYEISIGLTMGTIGSLCFLYFLLGRRGRQA